MLCSITSESQKLPKEEMRPYKQLETKEEAQVNVKTRSLHHIFAFYVIQIAIVFLID
jgi:hypothetical protein